MAKKQVPTTEVKKGYLAQMRAAVKARSEKGTKTNLITDKFMEAALKASN